MLCRIRNLACLGWISGFICLGRYHEDGNLTGVILGLTVASLIVALITHATILWEYPREST